METLLQDLRYALRQLRTHPAFAGVAVLSLSLGIAACVTIFSAIDAVILRALPFPDADRLVAITEKTRGCDECSVSLGDYATLREQGGSAFTSVAAYRGWSGTLSGQDGAERIEGYRVTPSYFSTLGVGAALGRTFEADSADPALAHTVVLSDQLWRARFGADAGVVGTTLMLSGEPYVVTGVMPPRFALQSRSDVWLPLIVTAAQANDYFSHGWGMVARLAPGVGLERARGEAESISRRAIATNPGVDESTRLVPSTLADAMVGELRQFFLPLLAAVAFVLLIVCANVANLMLARASGRQREIAVRAAMGGGQWRLFRQLFTESALIAGLGALLGVALAWLVIPAFKHSVPVRMQNAVPGWETFAIDGRALAFTVGLAAVSVLLFGTLPAWRGSRPELASALRDGARGATDARGRRVRRTLVIAELALAVVLLAGTGLMVRSFTNLLDTDTGLHAARTLTMSIETPARRYEGRAKAKALAELMRAEIGAIPGVSAVAGTWNLPLSGTRNFTEYNVSGRPPLPPGQAPTVTDAFATPGYFAALGIPLIRGRDFTARDDSTAPRVAIVSQSLAQRSWPGENPVGSGIEVGGRHYQVVGVVGDVRNDGVDRQPLPAIYRAMEQFSEAPSSLVVRARCAGGAEGCNPTELTATIRRTLSAIDPGIAISDVRTMPQLLSEYLTPWRLLMSLLGIFSALALVIAAIGIYGVMAYSVAQRTHEIGIRMALGADRRSVGKMVLRNAASLVVSGVVLGALGALALTRVLSSFLYGVAPGDPGVLGAVAMLLALVTLAASWLPARRATLLDPIAALRTE